MKIIKVNKLCEINQDNIAPCRYRRKIAINIVQQIKDEKGFINYSLAIDDGTQCCEYWSANIMKLSKFEASSVFVDRIEHGVEDDSIDIKWLVSKGVDREDARSIRKSGILTLVYGKDEELLCIGWVYNEHNGYYSHEVYTSVNGNIEVDCL